MSAPARLLALAIAAVLLVGCRTPGPPAADWAELEIEAPSENVLWEVVRRSMTRRGFPQGAGMNRAALTAETGWRPSLSPFKDKGFRVRAVVEVERGEEARTYLVRARVHRQNNAALVNPGDPRYAQWEWTDDDLGEARILLHHVKSYLDPDLPDDLLDPERE